MPDIGVESARECIRALGGIGLSIEEILEDGKIGISDIGEVPSVMGNFNKIAENWRQAKAEIADLQQDEANLLAIEFLNALFNLEAV